MYFTFVPRMRFRGIRFDLTIVSILEMSCDTLADESEVLLRGAWKRG